MATEKGHAFRFTCLKRIDKIYNILCEHAVSLAQFLDIYPDGYTLPQLFKNWMKITSVPANFHGWIFALDASFLLGLTIE